MKDALSTYEPKSGLFLKFSDGDEIKMRVLTLDPLVSNDTFENKDTGEVTISTKYAFTIYNWTEGCAQVMKVGPGLLNRFTRIHRDEDLPALNKTDIKISVTGEMLKRRYEVTVLPTPKEITKDILEECKQVDLEKAIKDFVGRLSTVSEEDAVGGEPEPEEPEKATKEPDEALSQEDLDRLDSDEPLDLSKIPF